MASLSTVVVVKDAAAVTVNQKDLASFEDDGWTIGAETPVDTAQSPTATLSWLTIGQLREIAVESGISNPTEYATKSVLVSAILRAKGLVTYA